MVDEAVNAAELKEDEEIGFAPSGPLANLDEDEDEDEKVREVLGLSVLGGAGIELERGGVGSVCGWETGAAVGGEVKDGEKEGVANGEGDVGFCAYKVRTTSK